MPKLQAMAEVMVSARVLVLLCRSTSGDALRECAARVARGFVAAIFFASEFRFGWTSAFASVLARCHGNASTPSVLASRRHPCIQSGELLSISETIRSCSSSGELTATFSNRPLVIALNPARVRPRGMLFLQFD